MMLTGGGALLTGIDRRIAEATQLPVRIADDPLHATILGVGRVLDELDWLAKHTTSESGKAKE